MPAVDKRAALEELARRVKRKESSLQTVKDLKAELFAQQVAVWEHKSEHKAVLCPRRVGKTELWIRLAPGECISNDNALIRIWASSRLRAKELLWDKLKQCCARHRIQIKTNEMELSIKFENGSEIRLLGADKDREVQKKRGDKTWAEIVLETQQFGKLLKKMVDDVIDPCLIDERQRGGGVMYMEGSPGPVCAGFWYDVTGREDRATQWDSIGDEEGDGGGWRCFRWMMTDNPHMPHANEELRKLKEQRRWTDLTPTFRREHKGLWVNDFESLFYHYDEHRNGFTLADVKPWGAGWHHVLGWDLGSRDDMALVVWGYHDNLPDLYEAYSWKKPGALSQEVIDKIRELESRGFDFIAKVADTQGGGKMYVEDVMARYSQIFEPAKKSEKLQHVRLMNDDFKSGHIKVQRGGELETELKELPIDPDWNPKSGEPPKEAKNFANHLCDAGLYSWRKARHYWGESEKTKPKHGTQEFADEEEQRIEEAVAQRKYEEQELEDYYPEQLDDW